MTDEKILEFLRSPKPDKALQKLYASIPAVKKHIRNNGGSAEDAEDIFQDGLLIFISKANNQDFKLTSSAQTYLYGICKFLWSNQLQKRKTYSDTMKNEPEDFNTEHNMIAQLEEFEKSRLAAQAIAGLGQKCFQILQAFYFEGFSMATIANKFGYSSEKVAKNQKYKCMDKARTELGSLKNQLN